MSEARGGGSRFWNPALDFSNDCPSVQRGGENRNFWARIEDGWRFVQMSQCMWGVPPLPLAPVCLELRNGGGEADNGDQGLTDHLLSNCPSTISNATSQTYRNVWRWPNARVWVGLLLRGSRTHAASPEPLWGPSLSSQEGWCLSY